MTNRTDFFHETLSATTEILGGTPGAWGAGGNGGAGFLVILERF
jgi:hypothetical protein